MMGPQLKYITRGQYLETLGLPKHPYTIAEKFKAEEQARMDKKKSDSALREQVLQEENLIVTAHSKGGFE